MSIYEFKVKDTKGEEVSMSEFKDKVLLIVNTATACGFTPQYNELQDLYDKYQSQGLEILDFPCNQFGNQAPGSEDEIVDFCQSNFGITFRQFAKVEVNGENEIPLYTYLKSQKSFAGFAPNHPLTEIVKQVVSQMDAEYESNSNIKWNFSKFLVGRDGAVVERFEPTADISEIEEAIKKLL